MKAGIAVDDRVESELLAEGVEEEPLYEAVRTFTDEDFPLVEADAVESGAGKPDRVDIQSEIEWVAANLAEWPDFTKAPSKSAVKWWLAVTKDAALARAFWMEWASKRLAPGDAAGRRKAKSTLDEGVKAEDAAVDEEALKRRLGMTADE